MAKIIVATDNNETLVTFNVDDHNDIVAFSAVVHDAIHAALNDYNMHDVTAKNYSDDRKIVIDIAESNMSEEIRDCLRVIA